MKYYDRRHNCQLFAKAYQNMLLPLDILLQTLSASYGLFPVLALELEWYVVDMQGNPVTDEKCAAYLAELRHNLQLLPLHSLDKEQGKGQVEAALLPARDIISLLAQEKQLRQLASDAAAALEIKPCFLAKPFPDDYGNGLHIHIHLEDKEKKNVYTKHGDILSKPLSFSLMGLLSHMRRDIAIFAGSDVAFARYVPHKNAPVSVCWGTNNRTVALRLPDNTSPVAGYEAILPLAPNSSRRIEHRVASAEANVEMVIRAILAAIINGLEQKIPAPPPVYGNAADKQYDLPMLIEI